jgi:asparagine N-glycosylation enzyme membrane subunit Stt3
MLKVGTNEGGCMGESPVRSRGVTRTVIGCVLILASAPVFLRIVPGYKGWSVVAAGAVAFAVLVAGIVLAGGWLGVFERRSPGSVDQPGCLQLLVTLLALLAGAVILYYVVYYGAGAYLRGEI